MRFAPDIGHFFCLILQPYYKGLLEVNQALGRANVSERGRTFGKAEFVTCVGIKENALVAGLRSAASAGAK